MQVRYVKTIVGWWNLYLVSHNPQEPVTVQPARMTELFAEISPKAKFGCGEISAAKAEELFGKKEVKIA